MVSKGVIRQIEELVAHQLPELEKLEALYAQVFCIEIIAEGKTPSKEGLPSLGEQRSSVKSSTNS